MFDALPRATKDTVYRRLREILSGSDRSVVIDRSQDEKDAALDILQQTKPEFGR